MEEQTKTQQDTREAIRKMQDATKRTQQEASRGVREGIRTAGDLASAGMDTMALWAEANQRVFRQLAELYAGGAKETARLYAEMQQSTIDAMRDAQATTLRWQTTWPEAMRDPIGWYQRSLQEGLEQTQRAFRLLGGTAESLTQTVERLQASAEETGRELQETLNSVASRLRKAG